ncbi:VIT domain-containing protein [Phytohabitans rumicis]|uniref:Inter-alpha-trypsin inhibitor domain-containing protein n=1 Tax=Phytohabitans rumicis TaxID=1076125 RepID=A0A6V8LJS5_9ACTN|nr:VIT domain-containing protein [Phytohabitans rumicis]GFJ95191.1 inter-alpha-trypsin inhibitor domain-containing protein [Phytohabitans rumicis]
MTVVTPMTEAELTRERDRAGESGLGALRTERGNLPLDRLDVRADITGLVGRIELTQDFLNVHDQALEATYVFPLPDRAAVTGMRMVAADRVVEAKLAERGAARQEYEQAIAAGKRASIAEEERPDVFTMRVGNILPGERVSVTLTLAGPLSMEDGEATFRFPLVVAPRYIPGAPLPGPSVGDGHGVDTDAVPDASRITPPVLLPGFPNPLRLSIDVGVDPGGLPLGAVRSSLHTVAEDGGRFRVLPGERADRDFVLRLAYGAPQEAAALVTVADPKGDEGTFQLTVLPPAGAGQPRPRDVVLLLDRSGSMGGWKMVAARRAAARIVDTLGDADRFAVLAFDHTVETPDALPSGLVAATDRHRFRAVEHLARMEARGGTELLPPLKMGVALLAAGEGERDRVLVLVTDGQVGNEDQILREAGGALAGVRIHTVGVDRAVNAGFLGRLASAGGGRCELVESENRLDEAMDSIHRRIGAPLVTGVSLVANGLSLMDGSQTPARLPDLFPGVPYVVSGRYRGAPSGALTLRGSTRDDHEWTVSATAEPSDNAALTAIWARAHLRDQEDRYVSAHGDPAALEQRIVDTSLRFSVLCRFTAYLAVDSRVVAEGGPGHRIVQPVEPASGWEMLGAGPGAAPGAAQPRSMAIGYAPQAGTRGVKMSKRRGRGGPPLPPPAASPAAAAGPESAAGSGFADVLSVKLAGVVRPAAAPAMPAPPVVEPAALAQQEAQRLRGLTDRPPYERREALEDLGSRLAALAGDGPLRELAEALRPDAIRQRPFEELWAYTLEVLDAVAGGGAAPDRRGSFWRRP